MTKLNDTLDIARAPVQPYDFSRPLWEATRDRKLLLQRCRDTGQFQFFPRPVSIATGRRNLEWVEVDGAGEVYSYSVTRRGYGPFRGHEPYAMIIARLDVGVDIMSNIIDCDEAELRVGLRIEPYWMPMEDGRHLLLFQPSRTA